MGAGRGSLPAPGSQGWKPLSGVSKERVTLWSGCTGLTVLAGFLGQRPKWDGATPSPSGEPTTSGAKWRSYNGLYQGKPCHVRHTSLPPAAKSEFVSSLLLECHAFVHQILVEIFVFFILI